MVINVDKVMVAVCIMGGITWGLRALPFFLKDWLSAHPMITFIKTRFSVVIMLILVFYASGAYKAEHFEEVRNTFCGIALTAVLQCILGNYFVSLFSGVVLYMVLINVF